MKRMTHTLCTLPMLTCNLVLVCLLSSLAGIGLPGLAEAAPEGDPPNILFIIMDDVGIDQMRVFGYTEDNQPRTPNIDAIASLANGVASSFRAARSTAAWPASGTGARSASS